MEDTQTIEIAITFSAIFMTALILLLVFVAIKLSKNSFPNINVAIITTFTIVSGVGISLLSIGISYLADKIRDKRDSSL